MMKRLLAVLLLLPIVYTLVFPADAAYENTHTNTGDMRHDIIEVAKTQLGYTEGYNNDTKYGDWYGLPNREWCGMFVSWCANQAGVPTSVLKKYARSNPEGYGLKRLYGSSYRPRSGDLFFKSDCSHVGLVWYVEGDYFYTLEGNAGSGSNKVVSNKKRIKDYLFGSPSYHGGAEHSYTTGYEEAHPHKEYKQCKNCNDKYYTGKYGTSSTCKTCIQASCSHTYGTWERIDSSKHIKVCSKCELEVKESHTWDSGQILKAATCGHSGSMLQTCTGCKTTKTVTIPKTEKHTFSEWLFVDEISHRRVCSTCKMQELVEHDHLETWSTDEARHWKTCETCKQEEISIAVHDFGDSCTAPCAICGYVRPEGHSFGQEWQSDETGHWLNCERCNEKGEFTKHTYSQDCSENCQDCQYHRSDSAPHQLKITSDFRNHWLECEVCQKIQNLSAHVPGPEATEYSAQYCTYCNEMLAEQLAHVHKYELTVQDGMHWGTCYCGQELGPEAHTWDMSTGNCAVCNVKSVSSQEPVNYDFVWIIFGSVSLGGMIVPVVVSVARSKKEKLLYT